MLWVGQIMSYLWNGEEFLGIYLIHFYYSIPELLRITKADAMSLLTSLGVGQTSGSGIANK